MSFFVPATSAPRPKTKNIVAIGFLAAGIIAVMTIGQLFTFENFPALIAKLWLPGGEVTAKVLASILVIIEVLALPFLLGMRLSPLFRVTSMVLGWCVVAIWMIIAFWENIMVTSITSYGVFGATIPLPVGWWNVFFSLALGILLVWASWGMWPLKSKKHIVPREK
jgi:hypothetical protein